MIFGRSVLTFSGGYRVWKYFFGPKSCRDLSIDLSRLRKVIRSLATGTGVTNSIFLTVSHESAFCMFRLYCVSKNLLKFCFFLSLTSEESSARVKDLVLGSEEYFFIFLQKKNFQRKKILLSAKIIFLSVLFGGFPKIQINGRIFELKIPALKKI